MNTLWQDLRYGVRTLSASPGFTLAAIVTLALGIGANAAMFGVVDALLFKPPAHVEDADQVVRVYGKGNWTASTRSYPDFLDLRDGTTSFAAVAAYQDSLLNSGRGVEAQQIGGQRVSQSYFSLLGVRPAVGRFFAAEEDRQPDGAQVIVIGHDFWQRQFGGDANAIGRELTIGDGVYTLIGVAPQNFVGVDLKRVEAWVPLGERPEWRTNRGNYGAVNVIARLTSGASVRAAERDANAANLRGYARDGLKQETETMTLGPLQRGRGPVKPQEVRVSQWLAAVALVVLLIACANVANLMLVRGIQRRREIAVRLGLGANRTRLVRQLLTESLLLAVAGGVAALLIAVWVGPLIRALVVPGDVALDNVIDVRLLGFTAGATLLTGLLCGIVPALQAGRVDLTAELKAGVREGTYQRSPARTALLVGQIAMAFVLLIGAGLFVRSLWNVRSVDLGFAAERLLTVNVNFSGAGYQPAEAETLYRQMLDRAQSVPGVERASAVNSVPFESSWRTRLYIPGRDPETWGEQGGGRYNRLSSFVTPDFFATTETPVLRGRGFTAADREGAPPVAILNEKLAGEIWPGEEALGKCLRVVKPSEPCTEVVGIVANTRTEELFAEAPGQYYLPLDQPRRAEMTNALLIRTRGKPEAVVETLRRELHTLSPNLPYIDVRLLQSSIEPRLLPWRLGATVFSVFGALALTVAMIGFYSVLSYIVSTRTHEIGIRLTLGAQRGDISKLLIGQGLKLLLGGLALGLLAALALSRITTSLLYGVTATDAVTLTAVAALFAATAFVACYMPARRATRVDPLVALRHE